MLTKKAEEPMSPIGASRQPSREPSCAPFDQWQDREPAADDTTCPLRQPMVVPAESKVVVLLHAYETAARNLEEVKQVTTEHSRCGTATSGHTSVIWYALQPLRWWIESCVRPAQLHVSRARSKSAERRIGDDASNADGETLGLS
ncbi:hypothetical protein LSCM4_06593 [Leishmania orientalis]|uniref:Uncharacterized protein n=1 Tax=Leishmania orientalis TaxID=2249476 RepID=A0A836GPA3_9TRYP|nr:hypothetical protein LSCM4_06593 [Leishmania orientalis]